MSEDEDQFTLQFTINNLSGDGSLAVIAALRTIADSLENNSASQASGGVTWFLQDNR